MGEVCAARDEFIAVEILGEIQSPVQPVAVLQLQHCLPFLQPVGFPLALLRPDIAEVNGMPHQFSGGVILGEDICELGQGTVHIHRNALLQGLRIQGVQPQEQLIRVSGVHVFSRVREAHPDALQVAPAG